MLIIGERINSSRKSIAAAISSADKAFVRQEAHVQDQAGADYIDVNAGVFLGEEIEKLKWVVEFYAHLMRSGLQRRRSLMDNQIIS